jgi:UDP-N-acetylmuramoyl-tripeptide--D-alanyl-D-alanine ligase
MLKFNDFKRCESFISFQSDVDLNKEVKISTDTRNLIPDDVFLALTGEKFNALKFLDQVIKRGCKFVIYTKNDGNDEIIKKYQDRLVFIETKNSEQFLQQITNCVAADFQNNGGKLIAISGSNGKTTTKEMLFHLLSSVHKEIICTQKNNNNHIGVPLTLLQINKNTKFAIVELGSNHPGEIELLCKICVPRIGVTTNIGDTHLEFFKNRESVFQEEGFLLEAIKNNKNGEKFFVNSDDEFLKNLESEEISVAFGKNASNFQFIFEKDHAIVKNNKYEFNITNKLITGQHNLFNLCVAFSIAKEIDETNTQKYLEAAQKFKPTANRSQWLKANGKDIFLDAYNANPSSMWAAICGFVEKVGHDSNYCLILGDMNELGDDAASYHTELATKLLNKNFKNFFFIGDFANSYNAGCSNSGVTFQSTESFKQQFSEAVLDKFDYIFIKGSRSLQLESLVDIN